MTDEGLREALKEHYSGDIVDILSESLNHTIEERNALIDMYNRLKTENEKLRGAVAMAAEIIADTFGECPVSRYDWLSSDGCAKSCEFDKEAECWAEYLIGKRFG